MACLKGTVESVVGKGVLGQALP